MIHIFADEKTSLENLTGLRSHSLAECKLQDGCCFFPPFCFLNSAQCLAHRRQLTPNPPFPVPEITCTPMSIVAAKTWRVDIGVCLGGHSQGVAAYPDWDWQDGLALPNVCRTLGETQEVGWHGRCCVLEPVITCLIIVIYINDGSVMGLWV